MLPFPVYVVSGNGASYLLDNLSPATDLCFQAPEDSDAAVNVTRREAGVQDISTSRRHRQTGANRLHRAAAGEGVARKWRELLLKAISQVSPGPPASSLVPNKRRPQPMPGLSVNSVLEVSSTTKGPEIETGTGNG